MINDAYAGKFQLILTKEVSRFSRNILDTISYTRELKSIGVGVLFVTDRINTLEPEAEMMLSFLASLAQEESRKTSSRVIWGQTRQMEKGVVFGPSLLGYYVKNGSILINHEEAKLVQLIFHKYALEQMSTSQIARFLNSKSYHSHHGNVNWKPNTIVKILKNEKYVGDLIQKKSYTPDFLTHEKKRNTGQVPLITISNHHEPIVSREVWNLTQKRLQQNNKHSEENRAHSNRYVFSGKIKCGECGATFVGRFKYLKDGTKIRRWCCGAAARDGTTACDVGKLVRDDDAMLMLKTAMSALQIDREWIYRYVSNIVTDTIQSEKECDMQQKLEQERNAIDKKKLLMMDSYFSNEITKDEMLALKEKYDHQLGLLQESLDSINRLKNSNENAETMKLPISNIMCSIMNGEIISDVFYKTILHSLTVFKDRHMELKFIHLPQTFYFIG